MKRILDFLNHEMTMPTWFYLILLLGMVFMSVWKAVHPEPDVSEIAYKSFILGAAYSERLQRCGDDLECIEKELREAFEYIDKGE